MFIFTATNRRANPEASYESEDGTRYAKVPRELLTEIPDPTPPDGYSDETYYRTEQDDAPYVIYTKKSDEQLAAIWWEKVKVQRDELTDNGGCLVDGKWFHTDPKSKQQQMALAMLGANIPADLQWKTMDGTFVLMTPILAASLFAAQVAREQSIFALSEIYRATPFVDVAWPDRYVEA
jgi:hypothetical protein